MKKQSRSKTRYTTPTAYPRACTINGCQPTSLYLEVPGSDGRDEA